MRKFVPLAGLAGWLVFGDWLAGLSLAILALAWVELQADEGPPVLALAVTMQWVSVSLGLFYVFATGRQLEATIRTDYRWMVLLGLGCVLATIVGLMFGRYLIAQMKPPQGLRPAHALSFTTLLLVYGVATATIGAIAAVAFSYDGLAQAIFALIYLRLGLLYLIYRRLVGNGQWYYLGAVLAMEIVLGITGFYAGFREPLMLAALAYLEHFDRRSVRQWAALAGLATTAVTLGILWVSIRGEYRARYQDEEGFADNRSARIELLRESVNAWAGQSKEDFWNDVDRFVERLWTIYYPALAVDRVPSVLPHTNGALMADTLRYVFEPRILFPDKPALKSDSEMVRKYSGVMVAGEDQATSIAFGYAAESYVDYGAPGMFVPVFIWALFIGVAYSLIIHQFRHRDIAVAMSLVVGWMSLYLFERSWAKTIGLGGTLLIYAGGLCYILDRLWFEKFKKFYELTVNDTGVVPIDTVPMQPIQLQPQPRLK